MSLYISVGGSFGSVLASVEILWLLDSVLHAMAKPTQSPQVMEEDSQEEARLENEYQRIRPDPSIGVADLEQALNKFLALMGYRNLQEVLD